MSPLLNEVRRDPSDENVCRVLVKGQSGNDPFGVPYQDHVDCEVRYYEDYGVVVVGTSLVKVARRALRRAGFNKHAVLAWWYRPMRVDQEPREWPEGLAVGGRQAVAFYF